MNVPNAITIGRILIVPVMIWLIISRQFSLAFFLFIAAGVSDGVDGFIAKRFNGVTALGAYLDPLADKLLLVSIFLTLGFLKFLPAWIVILVASRDVLIIGAILLSWLMDRPVEVKPLMVSKVNTVAQILLAGTVLFINGFGYPADWLVLAGSVCVGALTVLSGAIYMRDWIRHMANGNGSH